MGLWWDGRVTSRLHIGHLNARLPDVFLNVDEFALSSRTNRMIEKDFLRLFFLNEIEADVWSMGWDTAESSQTSCTTMKKILALFSQRILFVVSAEACESLFAAFFSQFSREICRSWLASKNKKTEFMKMSMHLKIESFRPDSKQKSCKKSYAGSSSLCSLSSKISTASDEFWVIYSCVLSTAIFLLRPVFTATLNCEKNDSHIINAERDQAMKRCSDS